MAQSPPPLGFAFTNVARQAGLTAETVYGGRDQNRYLLETTGCGVALIDIDSDGWLDVFLVNGTTFEGFPKGAGAEGAPLPQQPRRHLRRRHRQGGTRAARLGPGRCVGDYDNDGFDDLYVTYWGQNRLFRNKGDGTFEDVTARAGLRRRAAGARAAPSSTTIATAGWICSSPTTSTWRWRRRRCPTPGLCRYKGMPVACGPPGLRAGDNVLYRNHGDGTFEDVSERAGITAASGTYGLGVTTLDFDDDGWVDIYVAKDSNPSALYRNNRDGTFTDIGVRSGCAFSQDGKPQAGMGITVGDYDRNGTMDLVKTNFAGDTSTLYANTGDGFCDDRTFASGIGINTQLPRLGGRLPRSRSRRLARPVPRQRARLPGGARRSRPRRATGSARSCTATSATGGSPTSASAWGSGHGAESRPRGAFGDIDNDGDIDVVVNNVNEAPDLFRLDRTAPGHWLMVKLRGTRSNRNAIGARVHGARRAGASWPRRFAAAAATMRRTTSACTSVSGDLKAVDRIEVRWPNGLEETWPVGAVDRLMTLTEGTGTRLGAKP